MRQAAERVERRRASTTRSIPAPVRGWNARDSIAAMKPDDAVILDNWFVSATDIQLRKGSAHHVTGVADDVETLAAYRPETGAQKLFGWAGDAAYDVSVAGAVGAAVLSALSNARWQHVNVTTIGGHFLLAVNGADSLRMYDGAAWTAITGVSVPAITGIATNLLVGIHVHKERVWYIPIASLDVWYSAVGAFAGALTKLPLGAVFKRGGYLVAMGTWTIDGGAGADDLAVFVTSEGEVAVYQGIDPSSAATWSKIGTYTIGTPIGRRCLTQLGGDLLIITTDGVIPCSRLTLAKEDKSVAVTDNIQNAMADAVELYAANNGWEATFYPAGKMLFLNVPVGPALQQQFVMNTVTRRWCRFMPKGVNPGWPAHCFEVFNGALYFGMDGAVRKAWTGTADVALPIEAEVLCAFNYFGNPAQAKHFKLIGPIIGWDSNPAQVFIGVDVDFISTQPVSEITLPASEAGVWDDGEWDDAVWGGEVVLTKEWYGVNGVGFAGAFHMRTVSSKAQIRLSAIRYLFEAGEVFA